MKSTFLMTLIIAGLVQSSEIISSSHRNCSNYGYDFDFDYFNYESIDRIENNLTHAYLQTTTFLEHGLTYFQAEDAQEKNLTLEQALQAAQKNELNTVESYAQQHTIISSNFLKKHEQDLTQKYLSVTKLLKLGIAFHRASYAYDYKLSLAGACRLDQQLQARNGNKNNNHIDEICTQIKREESAAATKIAAVFRGYQARNNIQTGK